MTVQVYLKATETGCSRHLSTPCPLTVASSVSQGEVDNEGVAGDHGCGGTWGCLVCNKNVDQVTQLVTMQCGSFVTS